MIVLIDNYDSFTYNLVQRIGELYLAAGRSDPSIRVYRNDQVDVATIEADRPAHLIISPGPCTPREAGVSNDIIRAFAGRVPILGVCLGHQCIGHVFGATVARAPRIMHGKTSEIHHDGRTIFAGLPNPFTATRYHSLAIVRDTLPDEFDVSAWTDQDEIMAIRHQRLPLEGVQFHPESFLTTDGPRLLANFLGVAVPQPA
ncbi:MAG: aminodeoxychorismate/anthranilate synthase component II [Phycisphaerae bacterium]|nr:aminodeoxychorismate/anthranilate synthase component II [Phycisphaerae bacterium]